MYQFHNQLYKFNNQKGFGIEIEFLRPSDLSQRQVASFLNTALQNVDSGCRVESYNHITRPQWKIVRDASVHGERGFRGHNELVSPILYGQKGKKQLEIVLIVLNELGCKVNKTCGIHIHHDVTDTMVKNKKSVTTFLNNLIKFVVKFEHIIYRLVSPSRLTGRFSQPARLHFGQMRTSVNRDSVLKDITKRIFKGIKKDVDSKYDNYGTSFPSRAYPRSQRTRFCGLNLQNIWTRGSVEFRYMQGSLNFDKIWSWTVITQSIINITEVKKSITFDSIDSGSTGLDKFKRVLGFVGSKDICEDKKFTNKIMKKRYSELTKPELERRRRRSSYFSLTQAGV